MKNLLLPIIAALALGSQAQALELTVDQCVAMGLAGNPVLKAHEAQVESSRQDTLIAHSAFLPTLEAQGTYATLDQPQRIVVEKNLFGPFTPAEDVEIRGDKDIYTAGFTLRQTLYAGGRITHAYQRDNELLASARHEFGNRRTQLTYDLKRSFYESLIHLAYTDSYAQQVTARQEGLRVAMALAEEGQLSPDRVLQARARTLFSEAELLQARQHTANSLDQLRRLLALDNGEELSLVDIATYPTLKHPAEDLSIGAIDRREDYRQLEAQIRAAEESLQVARSRYLPEIYATGGYLRQSETDLARGDNWGASINLNWPLFEGGKTDAEVVKAQAEKQRLENLRRDLAAAIRNEVQAGERLVQQKQLLVEAYLVNLQAEERTYGDIVTRQEQGEVLAAEQHEQHARLLLAQANYLESIHQLRIAIAALEAATAAPLDGLVEQRAIYRMDLARLQEPPAATVPPQSAADTPAVPATAAALPTMAMQPPEKAVESPPPPNDNTAYILQLGAFKAKKRARAYQRSLQKLHPQMTFQTVASSGMYKVRSIPFHSRAAAVSALEAIGNEGLIIRAGTNR